METPGVSKRSLRFSFCCTHVPVKIFRNGLHPLTEQDAVVLEGVARMGKLKIFVIHLILLQSGFEPQGGQNGCTRSWVLYAATVGTGFWLTHSAAAMDFTLSR